MRYRDRVRRAQDKPRRRYLDAGWRRSQSQLAGLMRIGAFLPRKLTAIVMVECAPTSTEVSRPGERSATPTIVEASPKVSQQEEAADGTLYCRSHRQPHFCPIRCFSDFISLDARGARRSF